ncbi:MAG: phasin family protein [Thiohalocapsa sp.]
MSTKDIMSTYDELTSKSVERMSALGELNLKLAETVTSRQIDVMKVFMDQGVRMAALSTEAKGYSELYKGQVEMAKAITERMLEESKSNMKLAGEIRSDYRGWFDAAMADAKKGSTAVRNAVTV